jgi:hypothetical protein
MDIIISDIGLIITFSIFIAILIYILYLILNKKIKHGNTLKTTKKNCAKEKKRVAKRNKYDYFWKEYMTFSWITLLLGLSIFLGFSTKHIFGILYSVMSIFLFIYFMNFAIKNYLRFEEKAKKRIDDFEEQVRASIDSEISFNGDNIQTFTDGDDGFDTKVQKFEFPTAVTRIPFPPLEKNAKNHKIISTRRLEFLVLSREYFSICKNTSTFNLLDPKLDKKCIEAKGAAGECDEYYYSQMQNVQYDNEKECIRIIYNTNTGHKNVTFDCKKIAANRKPAMKALKEKLRLTERQKLHKINEHEKYEELKDRRENEEWNKKTNKGS